MMSVILDMRDTFNSMLQSKQIVSFDCIIYMNETDRIKVVAI